MSWYPIPNSLPARANVDEFVSIAVTGITFALVSSFTTATAHALLKGGKDKLAIRGMIGGTSAIVMLPVCLFVPLRTAALLPWLGLCSLLHTIYQLVLIRSYRLNGFSTAFPWARGVAPLSVMIICVVMLGERISGISMLGIATVSAGLLLIAGWRSIVWGGLAAATLTGALTAIYTVVDGFSIRLAPQAMTFVAWFFVLDGAIMFPLFKLFRWGSITRLLASEGRHGIAAGLASLVSFGSALMALRLIDTWTVSALRETSVVVARFIAAVVFKEDVGPRNGFGAAMGAVGAILIIYRPASGLCAGRSASRIACRTSRAMLSATGSID